MGTGGAGLSYNLTSFYMQLVSNFSSTSPFTAATVIMPPASVFLMQMLANNMSVNIQVQVQVMGYLETLHQRQLDLLFL